MPKVQTFNLTEAASLLGLSRQTLAKYLADGAPYVTKADRDRGIEWAIEIGPVVGWLVERGAAAVIARYEGSGGKVTKEEADRRRAVAQAAMAEIELDQLKSSVVLVADVVELVTAQFAAVRSHLQGVGAKVAGRAVAMSNAPAIQELVDDAIVSALENMTGGEDVAAKAVGDGQRTEETQ